MPIARGDNNFHIHSKAKPPRDRGISEEIELKDRAAT